MCPSAIPSLGQRLRICLGAALLVTGHAAFAQTAGKATGKSQHAHVHGAARLGVAVQDRTVTIEFESPLDNLIGFEHRPKTPAQRAAVAALQAQMRSGQGLFGLDAAARCTLVKSEAESPLFEPAAGAKGAAGEHSGIDASFEFRCASPEKLTALDVALFDAYPGLKRLQVEVATGKGQFKRDLKRPARTVPLVR